MLACNQSARAPSSSDWHQYICQSGRKGASRAPASTSIPHASWRPRRTLLHWMLILRAGLLRRARRCCSLVCRSTQWLALTSRCVHLHACKVESCKPGPSWSVHVTKLLVSVLPAHF